jgi:hypothetical protein
MKIYVAVAYLDRREWGGSTVWSWFSNSFELCLRRCMQDEGGDTLAAHVSLFFEDVDDDAILADVKPLLRRGYQNERSFFVDVLSDGHHRVGGVDDPQLWYRKWKLGSRVELYEVAAVGPNGAALDARAAYDSIVEKVKTQRPYDCYQNCNSVFLWPCRCSPSWGICCPCSNGTNCTESVLVALAAGFGAPEWYSEQALGLEKQVARGARLPSKLRDELVAAGVVLNPPRQLRFGSNGGVERTTDVAALPLLLLPHGIMDLGLSE